MDEIRNTCDDPEIRWKAARLVGRAEDLYEAFLDEYLLRPYTGQDFYKNFSWRFSSEDKIEALLSLAFESAAVLDSARYEGFEPTSAFRNEIKSIRKETLHLLHEKKGWSND